MPLDFITLPKLITSCPLFLLGSPCAITLHHTKQTNGQAISFLALSTTQLYRATSYDNIFDNIIMPSREEFFAQGPAAVESGAICPMCWKELEGRHPLCFPCHPLQVYCKNCIVIWTRHNHQCPFPGCKTRPWDLVPWTEVGAALINQTRTDMIAATLETFEVPPGTQADFITGSYTFGEGLEVPHDGQWVTYLAGREEPDMNGVPIFKKSNTNTPSIAGVGLAEPERLLLPIVNLANAIPLLADNSGRAYIARDLHNWRLIVAALLNRLPTSAKIVLEVEAVPQELRECVLLKVSAMADVNTIPFFQPGLHGSDLDLLLEYVAYTMWREYRWVVKHTPAGRAALTAYVRQRRSEFQQFEQATWTLEDSARHCATM